jgi:hypothetical protein
VSYLTACPTCTLPHQGHTQTSYEGELVSENPHISNKAKICLHIGMYASNTTKILLMIFQVHYEKIENLPLWQVGFAQMPSSLWASLDHHYEALPTR